ncbi:unnamed protein product [Rhizophagus irregularis]|uniref:HTH CENPB-type domain-containing protein n=1 Tax=Rhizophagus irregularis TaxID=588596 RepID=A0A916EG31_9GLOM|nr:unnamed protein product [Rhizophagus irregularis]
MSTRKRTILFAAQKREICETKEKEPNLSNTSIAQRYNIGKSTVTDILNEKERWLAISGDKESVKKFRGPKWPQLEKALGLWVDNALNTKQDIDGNILKTKAAFFAERFSIEDFYQSEGWLGGFKKRYGLRQFKKQGEASSAPSVESIENDRLALQQFLRSYNPEDIWNGDETGLFWKMELSRVLARGPISDETREKLDSVERLFIQNRIDAYDNVQDGIVEVLADYNIFEALQNSAEAWSMVSSQTISNCWKKTGILPPSDDEIEDGDSIFDDFEEEEAELERLIALLPEGDHLDAREYINIEDEMAAEGALTDEEIIDAVLNADKEEEIVINDDEFVPILEKVSLKEAEKSVDNTIRFLYEQGPEFGEVNEELRILKGLHKRVKLQLVKNLKQLNLHNFHD